MDKELVDIKDVKIDTSLPVKERIKDYIRQIKDPYCFKSNGITVRVKFAGTRTLEECLSSYIAMCGGFNQQASNAKVVHTDSKLDILTAYQNRYPAIHHSSADHIA